MPYMAVWPRPQALLRDIRAGALAPQGPEEDTGVPVLRPRPAVHVETHLGMRCDVMGSGHLWRQEDSEPRAARGRPLEGLPSKPTKSSLLSLPSASPGPELCPRLPGPSPGVSPSTFF